MTQEAQGRDILIGLSNPATMARHLSLARLLAAETSGQVAPFCVSVTKPGQEAVADHTYCHAREAAAQEGTREPLQVASPSLEQGVLQAVRDTNPALVMLGYLPRQQENPAARRAFARATHAVTVTARRHLLIARFGEPQSCRRLLLPLTSNINLEPIGLLARAMLREPGCELTLAHLLPRGAGDHRQAEGLLREAAQAAGLPDQVDHRLESAADPLEGILEMALEYDGVIVGAPRVKRLSQRLFGTTAEHVAEWCRCHVFIVRAAS